LEEASSFVSDETEKQTFVSSSKVGGSGAYQKYGKFDQDDNESEKPYVLPKTIKPKVDNASTHSNSIVN